MLLICGAPIFAQGQTVNVAPSLLSFTGTVGAANPASQSMFVLASSWTASVSTAEGGDWLSVTPTSGASPATLSVSVNAAALNAGAHNGSITVTSGGVSATTRVYASICGPIFVTNPSSLLFYPGSAILGALGSAYTGCFNPPNPSPAGPFATSAAVSTNDGGSWLSAPSGPPGISFVTVNQNGLAPGIYNGRVTVTPSVGPTAVVPVTAIIGQSPFTLTPPVLIIPVHQSDANPPAQFVALSFASVAPSWSVSAATSDHGSWLSAAPSAGSAAGTIAISIDKTGLAPGLYYGTVSVNAGTAGTARAAVTLEIVADDNPTAYTNSYNFPHLVTGGGWQTTLTIVNSSPHRVYCRTNFRSDLGGSLNVPFFPGSSTGLPLLAVTIEPGDTFHMETRADPSSPQTEGWANSQCTGPVQASLLFRLYNGSTAVSEAEVGSVNAATSFATFAQIAPGGSTGIAFANPSSSGATLTTTAFDQSGQNAGSTTTSLAAGAHEALTVDQLFPALTDFAGSLQITSSVPILVLAVNFEANPVFSSLPPAEINRSAPSGTSTYYFPHLVFGGGWQTTLTYVSYSQETVTCQTSFLSDTGSPLSIAFGDQTGTSRTDSLSPNGSVHQETRAALDSPLTEGWGMAQCSEPIKASLLFRSYDGLGGAVGEAAVNAMTAPATKFATFGQISARGSTGIAYANPSDQPATITLMAVGGGGIPVRLPSLLSFVLAPRSHGAATLNTLLGNGTFLTIGSVQLVSTVPIVSLSLNFVAAPSFSSLPPGDLPASTPMSTATGP